MKVISINVSLPKEVDWHGKKIVTSIFKTPVEGRRRVGKLNIEGDGQADLQAHGGEHRAIFVYQKDSYDYWRKELGREDLHYGQFGENLTVEGLADSEVCIGDRYQIGTAILEVTQPRATCFKVAFSTGEVAMPALLIRHKRPGFYFRVIREGDIGAGDEIVRLSNGKGGMTVAEVDGLLYGNAHPANRLREALGIEALSAGWRSSLQALYTAAISGNASGNAGLAPTAMVAAWQGFVPFSVTRIVNESAGVRSFELTPVDGRRLPPFIAGQHIVIRIPAAGGSPLIRMYSLCGPVNDTSYRIGVKAEKNGAGSDYLHRRVQLGQQLAISAPRGVFMLSDDTRPLVLLGAGIGITPLLAMLYAVDAGGRNREVWWVYTTQDREHYPFREEVVRMAGRLAGFRSWTMFTRPATGDVLGQDFDAEGRLTAVRLRQMGLPGDGEYYLCGPSTFMADVGDALRSIGIPVNDVKFEAFGAPLVSGNGRAPHIPDGEPGEGPLISFAKSGIGFRWHPRFGSLLEAAEACDVPVSWSCRVGVCHRCETTLFSGTINYTTEPMDQPTAGNTLICCSVPRTDVQLDL